MFDLKEYIEVPYSNRNYFIDKVGNVVDSAYHHIKKVRDEDGRIKVKLNWINGFVYYDLAFVICISYYRPTLPFDILLNEIEVCFDDDDFTNCHISNLYYKFRTRTLEVPGTDGLYYIPYYTQYVLDSEFNIYRLATLHGILKISWNDSYRGYHRNRKCESDFNQTSGLMRHRAIGLVFIDYPGNPLKLQINHMNGIKGDDRIENLEWVTCRENILHAGNSGLLKNFTGAIDVKRLYDDEVLHFESCKAASKALNIHMDLINEQLNKSVLEFIPTKGYLFKLKNDKWPSMEEAKKKFKGKYSILAKNVFTDEIIIFKNILDAHIKLNIAINSIRNNYENNLTIPTSGYLFRDMSFKEWPKYTKYHLEVFKTIIDNSIKYPQSYFFINKKDQIFIFFISLKDIMDFFNISTRELYRALEDGRYERYTIVGFDYSRETTDEELDRLKNLKEIKVSEIF